VNLGRRAGPIYALSMNPPARWLLWLARIGYTAKGIVYFLVGLLAIRAAMQPVKPAGTEKALSAVDHQPYGTEMLVVVAVGLACFVLWRAAQALLDADGKGRDWKAIGQRVGFAVSALFYAKLAKQALILAFNWRDAEDLQEQEQMAGFLFTQPLGQALVALAGLLVLGLGIGQFVKAYKGKFKEQLGFTDLNRDEHTWACRLATFGLVARGGVFCTLGVFIIRAAWTLNPRQVQSLQELLLTAKKLPAGEWVLGLVGFGLLAYGLFMGVQARYHRLGQATA
jgi:hypothetical protein